jgi:predicted PurR-regulated permease PerM
MLRPVLSLLAASAGLAYILDPATDWLERRGLSRDASIGTLFLSLFFGAGLVVLLFLPGFAREADEIRERMVPFIANLDQTVDPALALVEAWTGYRPVIDLGDLQTQAPSWVADQWPRIQAGVSGVAEGLLTQGIGILNAILNLTLLPVFVYYLIKEWDRLVGAVDDLVPQAFRPRVRRVAVEVDRRLSAFVRGQLTVSLIMAFLYSIGLLLVGIDLAVPVGVMSGALFVVPYLGTAVGIVLGLVLALMEFGFGIELVWVIVVFAVVQLIEGYLLTPRIVGDSVGLHPLVVMVALIVGGSLLGIWGMLLAIPITAVLSVFGSEWLELYRRSHVYDPGQTQ